MKYLDKLFGILNPWCEHVPFKDKGCHFIVGFFIAAIFTLITTATIGLIAATFVGAAKEYYDYKKGKWDIWDFIWTVGGGFAGVFVFGFLSIFF